MDSSQIFQKIAESVPKILYDLTINIKQFSDDAKKWLAIYDTDENQHSDFYVEEYDKLTSWVYERSFDSGHLIGGPYLYFFRNNDKIRIVWETEYTLENGISLWTARDGSFEMNFSDFVNEVRTFGGMFFKEMDKQIERTLAKDWGNVEIDKTRLLQEHKERKEAFEKSLSFFEFDVEDKAKWAEIEALYKRMANEILLS